MPVVNLKARNVDANSVTVDGGATIKLPPESGLIELWDKTVPGLALRISYGGSRSYTVTTRINGRQVRRKLGTVKTITLAKARKQALQALADAAAGQDTFSKTAQRRAAAEAHRQAERSKQSTFRAVAEAWLADTSKKGGAKLRSKQDIVRQLEKDILPIIGAVPVAEIRRSDIRDLVREIATTRPYKANRCLATIRRALAWAVEQDKLDANPAIGIDAPGIEQARDRVLSDDEIAKLWPAFEQVGYPFGPAFKLLLLTGCRRSEVGGMKWSEIADGVWQIPKERTKGGRPHMVPLSGIAREIIDSVPRIDGSDYVFTTIGDRPISGWSRPKERCDELSEVTGWRLHDLRRSVVTKMHEKLNIEPHVIEAVVGHESGAAKAGIAGVYNKATYLPQRRNALESWAQYVAGVVTVAELASNVVGFRRA